MNLLLLVLALTGLLGQVQAPAGVVEGYVLVAGTNPPEPLLNARAELSSTSGSMVVRTDNAGHFVFSKIPAARYRLLVTKDGYLRQELRAASRTQSLIDVRSGQTVKDIVFRMNPAPTISGIIRDRNGSPIANILVKALKRGYDPRGNRILTPFASTRTDDHGAYRLYWLDLGEYFLSAEREGLERATTIQGISASEFAKDGGLRSAIVQTTYAPTYFPGFSEPEDAKPIELELGRDAGGMDFVLSESTLATVAVAISSRDGSRGGGARGGGAAGADVTLTRPDGAASTARYGGRAQGGSLALGSIAPGTYLISASSGSERAAQRIRVTNADLYVRMTLSEGVVLNGSIVNNQGSPMDLRRARISIAEMDPVLPAPPAIVIGANNRFSISGVQRGLYSVNISGLPDDLYLKTAEYSSADALAKPFAVDDGPGATTSELKILIGLDGGRINGAAFDGNNQRFTGAQIILVPDSESRFRLDRYRYALAGEDGTFTLRGIPPGDYKLFAWDEIEANGELNTEYMRAYESLGTPVRIAPGENPALGLRVIQTGR